MIAELHNKISAESNNLERSEDKLTGDFFGIMRYLPFEIGMKPILLPVRFNVKEISQDWMNRIHLENGYLTDMQFWYRHEEGEIDLLIPLGTINIGIEIKYLSGISSEDEKTEVGLEYEDSCNQLARYSRMLKDISHDKTPYLIFLAPFKIMREVMHSIQSRSIIAPGVFLGFLCWEDVLDSLREIDSVSLDPGQQMIINDLRNLLLKKGFSRYKGLSTDIHSKTVEKYDFYCFNATITKLHNYNWSNQNIYEEDYYVFSNQ
ncbi:hypothetical protein ACN6MT_19465 [Neobacillus niacini]|uniref:hypothetical protein n=1 Tax=Neobacillus niacini TaxID=86668 RepID=UPI003B015E55